MKRFVFFLSIFLVSSSFAATNPLKLSQVLAKESHGMQKQAIKLFKCSSPISQSQAYHKIGSLAEAAESLSEALVKENNVGLALDDVIDAYLDMADSFDDLIVDHLYPPKDVVRSLYVSLRHVRNLVIALDRSL